jgi:hypothetical protein
MANFGGAYKFSYSQTFNGKGRILPFENSFENVFQKLEYDKGKFLNNLVR